VVNRSRQLELLANREPTQYRGEQASPETLRLQRNRPDPVSPTRHAADGSSAMTSSATRRASTGESTMIPISVLIATERGSQLKEPTKSLRRSTTKIFACRLLRERAAPARIGPAIRASLRDSNNSTPRRSNGMRNGA